MKRKRLHHLVVGQNFLRSLASNPTTVHFVHDGDNSGGVPMWGVHTRDDDVSASRAKVVTFDEPPRASPTEETCALAVNTPTESSVPTTAVEGEDSSKPSSGVTLSISGIVTYVHKLAWKARKRTQVVPGKRSHQVTSSRVSTDSLDERSSAGEASVSIACARGEVRFADTIGDVNLMEDRIPLVLSSWLTYRTPSQIKSAQRVRHTSSSSSDPTGLRPFTFTDNEEVSYRHLLVPYRFRLSRTSPAFRSTSAAANKRRLISEESDPPTEPHQQQQYGKKLSVVDNVYSRSSSVEPQASKNDDSCSSSSYPYEPGGTAELAGCFMYDIGILNNPQFGAAHHKMTFRFPFYTTSVIEYIDASEFKQQVNEKFKQKFPHIQLTYSKFKSLKREMRSICDAAEGDLLTVATAYVYFEKLILKALINKENRKSVAGVCLLLAAKLNDTRGAHLKQFIELIESSFRLDSRQLLELELPVIVALDFNLQLPDYEVYQHYQQLVSGINL